MTERDHDADRRELEVRRLELERDRLKFEKDKQRDDFFLSKCKFGATLFVSLLASVAIPWLAFRHSVELERLKVNAASVEHVRAVLAPDLAPDARRRTYEYLFNAFAGTPLRDWAKRGLDESTEELRVAQRERDAAQLLVSELRKDRDVAFETVRNLEEALRESEDAQSRLRLEEQIRKARSDLSQATEKLTQVSASRTNPSELNTEGLRLWRVGEQTKSLALFEEACEHDYVPACFNLAGVLYRSKFKDWTRSEVLYRRVCEQNRGLACTELGDLLMQQTRVDEGMSFYAKGCQLGDKRGCEEVDRRGDGSFAARKLRQVSAGDK